MTTIDNKKAEALPFLLVSSFNMANFATLLTKESGGRIEAVPAPFGQVTQSLAQAAAQPGGTSAGIVVWTLPEHVSSEFGKLLAGQNASVEAMLAEVDGLCASIKALPNSVKYIFVPSWVLPPEMGSRGLRDMHPQRGVSLAVARMNVRLAERLAEEPRAIVLDAARWVSALGEKSFSQRLWYMSKTPFAADLFKRAASDILSAVDALLGKSRKLILLDLDDTLWGGIVGDLGWQNVRLGGHDPVGEAYRDFQATLKSLKARGILLGIVSKNEEATALEAIKSHPEMLLRLDDFAGWRINWRDKAQNAAELAAELNLGLQSIIFIDDNPIERDRVRNALPEILVPEWPANPMEYKAALERLRCFDTAESSEEDRQRSEMYASERRRRESQGQGIAIDDWLQSLEMKVTIDALSDANLDRAVQLLNKTNQLNLSTRRLTREELWDWSQQPGNFMLAFRVADKFGDYGLVGLASATVAGEEATIVDYILSCRVMERKVEETMLHALFAAARQAGAQRALAVFKPTAKNQPCLRFFERSGMSPGTEPRQFLFQLSEAYPKPAPIALHGDFAVEAARTRRQTVHA